MGHPSGPFSSGRSVSCSHLIISPEHFSPITSGCCFYLRHSLSPLLNYVITHSPTFKDNEVKRFKFPFLPKFPLIKTTKSLHRFSSLYEGTTTESCLVGLSQMLGKVSFWPLAFRKNFSSSCW